MRAEIPGDELDDPVLEALARFVGVRQVVGIRADAKFPGMHLARHEQADRQERAECALHGVTTTPQGLPAVLTVATGLFATRSITVTFPDSPLAANRRLPKKL